MSPAWTIEASDGLISVMDARGVPTAAVELSLLLGNGSTSARDRVLPAALSALDSLQTELAEETTEPWPDHGHKAYSGLPQPDGEIVGHELRLWFGPAGAPAV